MIKETKTILFPNQKPVTGDKILLDLKPYFEENKESNSRIAYLYFGGNIKRRNGVLCVVSDKGYVCAKDGDVCTVRVFEDFVHLTTDDGGSITLSPDEYAKVCLLSQKKEDNKYYSDSELEEQEER